MKDSTVSRKWVPIWRAGICKWTSSVCLCICWDLITMSHTDIMISVLERPSRNCTFPSVLWHCWLGNRKGIWPVKKLDVGLLVVTISLELCMSYSSSCHHHLNHPASLKSRTDILIPTNPGPPGKWPLKQRQKEFINCTIWQWKRLVVLNVAC